MYKRQLKTALQFPALAGAAFDALAPSAFAHPAYAAVRTALAAAGGAAAAEAGERWVARVIEVAANDAVRSVVTELAVEPLRCAGDPDQRYVDEQVGRISERLVQLQVVDLKSRLQRIDPTDTEQYNRVFGELIVLEQQRRQLRDQAIGGA